MPINASQVSKLEIRVCAIVYETNINKLRKTKRVHVIARARPYIFILQMFKEKPWCEIREDRR